MSKSERDKCALTYFYYHHFLFSIFFCISIFEFWSVYKVKKRKRKEKKVRGREGVHLYAHKHAY